jgi:alcohol dehydrogenase
MFRFDSFDVTALPRVIFGAGRIGELAAEIRRFGQRALLVTGVQSFRSGTHWPVLTDSLAADKIEWDHVCITGEPSPEMVDQIVAEYHGKGIDVVVGIGGGSAMDGAKAVAGLLLSGDSVMDYLEGVGRGRAYHGPATPLIAVPTTAGTGSEATKNAVLSKRGDGGFKKSFRDPLLVPRVALLDPDLMKDLPPSLMASQAMDALTQLIESYVSPRASPFTDALALSGIEAVRDGLFAAVKDPGKAAADGRAAMMYAAYCSGITLAQAGLGVVHCLASPLGAFFPIPHGVVCGTLLGAATRVNIAVMQTRDPGNPGLARYARIGRLLSGDPTLTDARALTGLADILDEWVGRLDIPGLSRYGVRAADFPRLVAGCRSGSNKTNPLVLTSAEMAEILTRRL